MAKPVFIAGVGGRSGTTLVQRIINAHPEAWIWGEIGAEDKLTESWEGMNKWREMFGNRDRLLYKAHENGDKLESAWVSALIPSEDRLRLAWRSFFEEGFKTKRIWGFKTISCEHLSFMRYLFPSAKIIVTIRSPLEQYKSYRTGIDIGRSSKASIEKIKAAHEGYLRTMDKSDLLLDLDTFDPVDWVERIFQYIEEPVPPQAIVAAKNKVRGPVPLPIKDVEEGIEEIIHAEIDPLQERIRRNNGEDSR